MQKKFQKKQLQSFQHQVGDENAKTKCLIFDSYYDNYKGAVAYVRVFDGKIKTGDEIKLMASNDTFNVTEVGYFLPGSYMPAKELKAGEVRIYCSKYKKFIRHTCRRYNNTKQ